MRNEEGSSLGSHLKEDRMPSIMSKPWRSAVMFWFVLKSSVEHAKIHAASLFPMVQIYTFTVNAGI
jgi:hypothetical protein